MGTNGVSNAGMQVKVYSDDKKLYKGMSANEAANSNEQMQIFNSADIDKDGVISDMELSRYNGPIVAQSFNDSNGKNTTVEFYTGLKIDDVKSEGKATFSKIDENNDGVLSLDEMKKMKEIDDKFKKYSPEIKKHSGGSKSFAWSLFGASAFLFTTSLAILGAGATLSLGVGLLALGCSIWSAYLGFHFKNSANKHESLKNELEQNIGSHPWGKDLMKDI